MRLSREEMLKIENLTIDQKRYITINEYQRSFDFYDNNVDCYNCVDCVDCVDCKNCKDCYRCVGCKNCKDCYRCVDCCDCELCGTCNSCKELIKISDIFNIYGNKEIQQTEEIKEEIFGYLKSKKIPYFNMIIEDEESIYDISSSTIPMGVSVLVIPSPDNTKYVIIKNLNESLTPHQRNFFRLIENLHNFYGVVSSLVGLQICLTVNLPKPEYEYQKLRSRFFDGVNYFL
jgi:hypothetical protein